MKMFKNELGVLASHLSGQNVRFALFVLTIVLLVIGAGAPDAGGGVIIRH